MSYTIKPQTPLMLGENSVLPLTSYDQIILPNGKRWNGKTNIENLTYDKIIMPDGTYWDGTTGVKNVTYDQILMPDGTYWDGQTGSDVITYDQIVMPDGNYWNGISGGTYRIAFTITADGWTQLETGRYMQTVSIDGMTSHSQCQNLDVDMTNVTEETINALREAWSLIDNVETVDGGMRFTAFDGTPEIDIDVIADVYTVMTTIPNMSGVSF